MNINDEVNFLTLVQKLGKCGTHDYGIFLCRCGTEKRIRINAVVSKGTKSCGCHRKLRAAELGKKSKTHGKSKHPLYIYWSSIKQECSPDSTNYKGHMISDEWTVFDNFFDWAKDKWETGKTIIFTTNDSLYSEDTCKFIDSKTAKSIKLAKNRTGMGTKHGKTNHPLFSVWNKMKQKCYNPNCERYIEGINVCDEWKDNFENFYEWAMKTYEKGLIFNRINQDLDFYPENCIFLSRRDSRLIHEEKAKETNLNNFGYEYAGQSPEKQKKQKQTLFENYGVTTPLHSDELKQKLLNTVRKKYGVDNVFQHPDVKNKSIETNIEKYGVPHPPTTNKQQDSIRDWINSFGYDFLTDRSILNGKEIDMY